MIPWRELGRSAIPGTDVPLVLMQHGSEYVIRLGAAALMSSASHGSEDALAERGCAHLAHAGASRTLVGGLGMGFTLAAALRVLPAAARVVVAELIPAVVDWNRGPLADLAGRPLEDARVSVQAGDVASAIRSAAGAYDAILLDVDNGPEGIVYKGNDSLYSAAGLAAALAALKPGGVLAVWSQGPDSGFTRRLKQAGFAVEEISARAHAKRGARHVIWIAAKP